MLGNWKPPLPCFSSVHTSTRSSKAALMTVSLCFRVSLSIYLLVTAWKLSTEQYQKLFNFVPVLRPYMLPELSQAQPKITFYEMLQGTLPVDVSRLFLWQSTNILRTSTDTLPAFDGALAEKSDFTAQHDDIFTNFVTDLPKKTRLISDTTSARVGPCSRLNFAKRCPSRRLLQCGQLCMSLLSTAFKTALSFGEKYAIVLSK